MSSGWRYNGPVLDEARNLRAILTVSAAGLPTRLPALLRARDPRALGLLGFAGAVAEMALGLALARSRDIPAGDRDMRSGDERRPSAA